MIAEVPAPALPDFLEDGFRSFVADDRSVPFGAVYAFLVTGEDITADLAAAFRLLPPPARKTFGDALCTVFRRLDTVKDEDRRALKLVLRLATKIRCYDLLAFLPAKVFRDDGAGSEADHLRSLALDASIELSAGAPRAAERLGEIALSRLFRPSAAAALLMALASAAPGELLDHMRLLEKPLVAVLGDSPGFDRDLRVRRQQLIADLSECALPTAFRDVVSFALRNPEWPLAWIGELAVAGPVAEGLDVEEAARLEELSRFLTSRRPSGPDAGPDAPTRRPAARADLDEATSTLNNEEVSPADEERVLGQVILLLVGRRARLVGPIDSLPDFLIY